MWPKNTLNAVQTCREHRYLVLNPTAPMSREICPYPVEAVGLHVEDWPLDLHPFSFVTAGLSPRGSVTEIPYHLEGIARDRGEAMIGLISSVFLVMST